MNVVIVDYGMGNIHSVYRKLKKLKANVIVSSNYNDIQQAGGIILPGVGHFGRAMDQIVRLGLKGPLDEAVIEKKIPVLGICLGMQLMASYSEEGQSQGLGWIEAEVKKLNIQDSKRYKIPHTGWNTLNHNRQIPLFADVPENAEFYFVHSYYVQPAEEKDVVCETVYERQFCSVIARENIYGVQFHPEKSHLWGIEMLKNFLEI